MEWKKQMNRTIELIKEIYNYTDKVIKPISDSQRIKKGLPPIDIYSVHFHRQWQELCIKVYKKNFLIKYKNMSEKENQKESKEIIVNQTDLATASKKEEEKKIQNIEYDLDVVRKEKEFHEKQYEKFREMAKTQNIPMFYMEVHKK